MINEAQEFYNAMFGGFDIIEIEGVSYFPATKCAEILGYVNPRKAIRDHCKGTVKTITATAGGLQEIRIISEGDLWRLIVRSRLPVAKKLEEWIFSEVIPSVDNTGRYETH